MEVDKKKYEEYVKEITPVHSLPKSMACQHYPDRP